MRNTYAITQVMQRVSPHPHPPLPVRGWQGEILGHVGVRAGEQPSPQPLSRCAGEGLRSRTRAAVLA